MLKWLAPVAAAILCFLLVQGDLWGQSPTVPAKTDDVAANPKGDRALEVTWDAPNNGGSAITAYGVRHITTNSTPAEKQVDSNWTIQANAWTSGPRKYLINTGLDADVSYDVQVRAVNDQGDGAWSDSAKGTPRKIPAAPNNVSVAYGDEELTVTWSAPTGDAPISGYDISYRESSSGGWNTQQFGGVLDTLEHTISNLDNGKAYNVKVRALNVAGEGPWADFPNTVTPKTVPDAPVITGEPDNGKITLTWDTPETGGADITRYDLRYVSSDLPDKDTRWTTKQRIGSQATVSYELSGLENGKSYDIEINAHNNVDPSEWSNTVVETPRTVPSSPTISSVVNSIGPRRRGTDCILVCTP